MLAREVPGRITHGIVLDSAGCVSKLYCALGTVSNQQLNDILVPRTGRHEERGNTVAVCLVDIGPALRHKKPAHVQVAFLAGDIEWGEAVVACLVDIGRTLRHKKPAHVQVSILGGEEEWGTSVAGPGLVDTLPPPECTSAPTHIAVTGRN